MDKKAALKWFDKTYKTDAAQFTRSGQSKEITPLTDAEITDASENYDYHDLRKEGFVAGAKAMRNREIPRK